MKRMLMGLCIIGTIVSLSACKSETVSSDRVTEVKETKKMETESASEKESETQETEKKETLTVAVNAKNPPYEYYKEDEIIGIDVDLLQEIADELQMELVLCDMPSDAIISAILAGKADIGIDNFAEREALGESVNFSDSYIKRKQVMIVREDSSIDEREDLRGKTIGVLMNSEGEVVTRNIGAKRVIRFDIAERALEWLAVDKVDVIILDEKQANVFVTPETAVRVLDNAYEEQERFIAVTKEDDELQEQINDALAKLKKSGQVETIAKNYIHVE